MPHSLAAHKENIVNNPNTPDGWPDPDGPTVATPQFQRPAAPPQQPPAPAAGWGQQPAPHSSWTTPPPQQHQPWGASPPTSGGPAQGWPAAQPQPSGWPTTAPGAPPAGPRRNRRKLVIIAAAAVVALVAAVVVVPRVTGGGIGGAGLTPSETVTAYLEALSSGNAEEALSYGKSTPANTDFLNDEVLGKQIAKMPITNIRIVDDGEGAQFDAIGMSTVRVAADFGASTSDVGLRLSKVDDQWKLDNAFSTVEISTLGTDSAADKTLTLFGESLEGTSSVYVFPGFTDLTSSNKNISVKTENILLKGLEFGRANIFPKYELSESGTAGVNEAVAEAFAACERSNLLNPPGCPYEITRADAVEGTVTWGRADLSQLEAGFFDARTLTVRVAGTVAMRVNIHLRGGNTADGTIDKFFSGNVDLSTTPPELTY